MERRFSPCLRRSSVLRQLPESAAGHFPSAAEKPFFRILEVLHPAETGRPGGLPAAVSRAPADHFTRALTVSSSTPESGLDPVLMK